MMNNFLSWGERRRADILNGTGDGETKAEECRKLDERMGKFKDKFLFVERIKEMPWRKRVSITASSST
jgi:hypothetical protein